MNKGLLFILSGPSGVGKGTIRKKLDHARLNLEDSISMTTRSPRSGEQNGVDYYFVSKPEFFQAVKEGRLLEHACFVDNWYGTPLAEVERLRNEGKNVLLEIEVQGALQAQRNHPDAISIFMFPPSMEELEKRIRGRSTEPEEVIRQRLDKAQSELKLKDQYKYTVCNDDPELAAKLVTTIMEENIARNTAE